MKRQEYYPGVIPSADAIKELTEETAYQTREAVWYRSAAVSMTAQAVDADRRSAVFAREARRLRRKRRSLVAELFSDPPGDPGA